MAPKTERLSIGPTVIFLSICLHSVAAATRYLFVSDTLPWIDAKASCEDLGGQLAKIEDEQTNNHMASYLRSHRLTGDYWFGANDLEEDGHMVYPDGTELTYQNWYPGEPTNFRKVEHCAQLFERENYMWNDAICEMSSNYICQLEICHLENIFPLIAGENIDTQETVVLSLENAFNCNAQVVGWEFISSNVGAFQVSILQQNVSNKNSFTAKKQYTLSTMEVGTVYHSVLEQQDWTVVRPGDVVAISFSGPVPLSWSTENGTGHVILTDGERLVLEQNGAINVDGLEMTYRKYPIRPVLQDLDGCSGDPCHNGGTCLADLIREGVTACECPANWRGPRCEREVSLLPLEFHLEQTTWMEANAACERGNGSLVLILDQESQDYIEMFMHDFNITGDFWIGVNDRVVEGRWQWQDNYELNFNNWKSNPQIFGRMKDCACMREEDEYKWEASDCNERNYYICQMFKFPGPQCINPLGMESREIEDDQITASSTYDMLTPIRRTSHPTYSRLGTKESFFGPTGGWIADRIDENPWLQVDLRLPTTVTGIRTAGRISEAVFHGWLITFKVGYSLDGDSWNIYQDTSTGVEKIFPGNQGRFDLVTNYFVPPVFARIVRVYPVTWDNEVALQMELYGCKGKRDVLAEFVRYQSADYAWDNRKVIEDVSDEECALRCLDEWDFTCLSFVYAPSSRQCYLRDESAWTLDLPLVADERYNARIYRRQLCDLTRTCELGLCTYPLLSASVDDNNTTRMSASSSFNDDHVPELGRLVAGEGGWVPSRNDGSQWLQVFHGNYDQWATVENYLPQPVMAQFVRIHPRSWNGGICLMVGVIGCIATGN
ncbi:EGF-like repeat and discoidin I-like domain-containing protein 3 [Ptychodera flava]|uniref:EGF-like repeat and discoidin I-like domain-containing protein 3 n=1 Tax=Ptychodera flava TaxID=63121 RepID=UPI00396AA0CB